jgi:hypothetical protein
MAAAVTLNVNVQVPVSPWLSESVPETVYVPTGIDPVVEINPVLLTLRSGLEIIVTNVTAPSLSLTVIGPAV